MDSLLSQLFAEVSALETDSDSAAPCTLESMELAAARYDAAMAPLQAHVLDDVDYAWLETALREGGGFGQFAVEVIRRKQALSERFFVLYLRAAIDECDPTTNRSYVEPLVARFGLRRVIAALLEVFSRGGPADKAGALNALYWAQAPLTFVGDGPLTIDNATPESRALYLAVEDLRQQRDVLFLRAFVEESDQSLRRCLLARITLDADAYPPELRPLVERAQRIAREGF